MKLERRLLRQWIVATSARVSHAALRDDTPLLETRIVTSLQLMDLIVYVESLAGKPIAAERLVPGSFRDIDTICCNFLEER